MKFKINDAVTILTQTPRVLKNLLAQLPTSWTDQNEGPDTWSPYDVVGHLIHGEKTDWLARTKIILKGGKNITFEPFDRFAQFEDSEGKSLEELLREFAELRHQNLEELRALNITDEDLAKPGIHPELGPVNLKNLLATWVAHDLGHIAQIVRVMSKQYRDQVGPWTAYISILNK